MTQKLERDFVSANLAAVEALLAEMTDEDDLSAMSLEAHRDELRAELAKMEATPETTASATLFFSGRPVIANRGIEAEFGADAAKSYQDIVTRQFAYRQTGRLGQRGNIPGRDQSKLYITHVVRGSFGFRLEELAPQTPLLASALKEAMDETARVMLAFAEPDEEVSLASVTNLDGRVLDAVRGFFDLMRRSDAVFRLVSGELDRPFDRAAVQRAAERASITTLRESDESLDGELAGVLPERRLFEYRTAGLGTIGGVLGADLADDEVARLNLDWVGKPSRVTVRTRQAVRGERTSRPGYTLLAIGPGADAVPG